MEMLANLRRWDSPESKMTKELNLLFFLIWSTPTSLPMVCLAPRMTVFGRTAITTQGENRNDSKRGARQTTLDQIRRHLGWDLMHMGRTTYCMKSRITPGSLQNSSSLRFLSFLPAHCGPLRPDVSG
jgi:hypothetical protein